MNKPSARVRSDFKIIVGAVACLIVIGFIFIYSASSFYAFEYAQSSTFFLKKQLIGLTLGLFFAWIFSRLPLRLIYYLAPITFIVALGLTALTLIPQFAYTMHGSSRWLQLGGFIFQPSELLKWALIIYIANMLARKESVRAAHKRYLPALIILGLAAIVLLKQPDFGLTATLGATVVCLFFIAYPDWRYVFGLCFAAIPVLSLLIYIEPYRVKRILTFLNPWQDPQGAGFQVIQSLIAIGSGGALGLGISHSKQKFFYLPMQHTDFIYSIIGEETGFLGAGIVILLYILILYKGLQLSWRVPIPFGRYIIQGFVSLVTIQSIINIAVAVGLFPTKGIGLPFVSYGNSSLLCAIAMMGVIARIVKESNVH